jgi:hypothetical protein
MKNKPSLFVALFAHDRRSYAKIGLPQIPHAPSDRLRRNHVGATAQDAEFAEESFAEVRSLRPPRPVMIGYLNPIADLWPGTM